MSAVRQTLVVLDGRVTDEKLAELLNLQTEQPELDFKRIISPGTTEGLVELALHVGAMSVGGGYLVAGVDGHGVPTGEMDSCDARLFDEARLAPKLRKYLPDVSIRSRVTQRDGHTVVLIYVEPHPNGYAIFLIDGKYRQNGKEVIAFRAGQAYRRDGTRSVRILQAGMEHIIARRIAAAKSDWIDEQQAIRRREREELANSYAARDLARAPLGTLNFGLAANELRVAVLELLRDGDRIALNYLMNDGTRRAAAAIEHNDEDELTRLLDKIAGVGAICLEYEQDEPFARIIGLFTAIYSMPIGPHDDTVNPSERAARAFLAVIERIYGLGALAVRLRRWEAIRVLTLQHPERMSDHYKNWLKHALTVGSRAKQVDRRDDNGETIPTSLLTRAALLIEQVPVLQPDSSNSYAILTSLAQFDLLANLAAIDDSGSTDTTVFYPNWARFEHERIDPIADRVITDPELRQAVFRNRGDADLAIAFQMIGEVAHNVGFRYDGFMGWGRTLVAEFIHKNAPPPTAST